MLRDAHMHATLRRVPAKILGIILLHLPHAWPQLEYLAESGQESSVPLMQAVQMPVHQFAAKFPEYAKWCQWKYDDSNGQVCGGAMVLVLSLLLRSFTLHTCFVFLTFV